MKHSLFFCLLADMTFLLTACSIAGSKDNHLTSENGKLAAFASGRPAFQQHTEHAEGNDTTPRLAHSESTERRVYKPQLRQKRKRSRSPAGPRRLRDSDTHKRIAVPKAFCVLRERLRPRPKSGKVRRSDTRPGDVCERAERAEGSDTTPI